jgi:hypothetical protein
VPRRIEATTGPSIEATMNADHSHLEEIPREERPLARRSPP